MKMFKLAFMFPVVLVAGCEQSTLPVGTPEVNRSSQELQGFIQRVKGDLVFVEGGEFLMGDYGVQYGPEKLPYDANKDSKPLHKIELSSYSITKYKITNREYQFYLNSNDLQLRRDSSDKFAIISGPPNTPAHLDWFEAEKYCNWLTKVSELPFGLPTEAQWEYAARSRGQFLMVATNDGTYKATDDPVTEDWEDGPKGINISSSWDRKTFAKEMGWKTDTLTPLPVDRFPPNPLGIYSMSDNGFEWVKDWYDPTYYESSPLKDPQGPGAPAYKDPPSNYKYAKVLRGKDYADPQWGGGVNVHRSYRSPDGSMASLSGTGDLLVLTDKTARCVVNHPRPIE
ncbi:formylglycine-generating enzyme family protein [Pseudomonas umsongensis]|uniref:formylglycine-generating enzyme family protein n=1 Tax=Pseudomonas umsongensis TaxID=198618 RepID=UPI00200A4E8A|nr:SUMF1/EgtB/PvdO family nonheme iron enzyme [Pseudomonas umsongensis]MCK8658418.1 formylglycine-generating enzyme family protein [Pseudomonas umsongensis]